MVKGNTKKLTFCIIIVMFLLGTCGVVDSVNETEQTVSNINSSIQEINTSKAIMVNDTSYVGADDSKSYFTVKTSDKLYTEKQKTTKKIKKHPTITITGYPTCYTCWRNVRYHKGKTSYINYCPNCRKYGTLRNNPKHVADGEITCSKCDCDFCCYCGRDKVGSCGRHNWNILIKA